jgi:hypothetical protein
MNDDALAHLERLRAATARVGATLVAFDTDPTVLLLDASARRGVTAVRWRTARLTIAWVFERYRALGDGLERAAATSPRQLAGFVVGPSIALAGPELDVAERGLLDGSRRVTSWSPDDLLAAMTADFDEVRALVADVAAVWADAVPRIAGARARIDDLATRAAAAGIDVAVIDVDEIAVDVAEDPLGLAPDRLDVLDAELDAIDARIAAVAALRADTAATLVQAGVDLESLGTRLAALATIEDPSPSDVVVLRDQLDDVRELAASGAWADAAERLTAWRDALGALARRLDAAAATVARDEELRTELMGRLRAYAAKADRLALLEADGVAACRREALAALASGDVSAASERVAAYQELVNAGAARVRGRS